MLATGACFQHIEEASGALVPSLTLPWPWVTRLGPTASQQAACTFNMKCFNGSCELVDQMAFCLLLKVWSA